MSDFRVILPPDVEFSDRELDWAEGSRNWRLSDKEYGSVTWEYDRGPTDTALDGLREFFEIPRESGLNALAGLSPGELASLHSQANNPSRIVAVRCHTCGQNWIVYKLSGSTWLKYGRKCDSGWWLGEPVADGEVTGITGN